MSKETYRPLPNSVTIKESSIHGLGIFATQLLEPSARLGRTHVDWEGHLIRTPLGGFINHSDNPNCFITTDAGDRTLYATMPIKEGDEITVYYRFKGYDGIIHNDTEPDIGC